MLTLCGFPISNYYNKVKLALLEKGAEFTEQQVMTGSSDEAVLASSPLAKVPFIRTEHGALCESEAIMGYIEATWPEPALMPSDAWATFARSTSTADRPSARSAETWLVRCMTWE